MTEPTSKRPALLRRPRIERMGAAYSQRLPAGRALVELELSGWGLLYVGPSYLVPYRGVRTVRFAVPLGETLKATVFSPLGSDYREFKPEWTLPQAPDCGPGPVVAIEDLAAPLGADPGRDIASRVPRTAAMPAPVLPTLKPRLTAVVPRVSITTTRHGRPSAFRAAVADAHMPAVRREALWPSQMPADEITHDTHRGRD